MAKKAMNKSAKKGSTERSKQESAGKKASSSAIDEVKQLIKLMVDNELSELNIEEGQRKVLLKRNHGSGAVVSTVTAAGQTSQAVQPIAAAAEEKSEEPEELLEIKSPMVGTFYTAAGPDSEPYVSVGDVIGTDAVVAIVEAMKVMNEIKGDCAGTIAEICVKNAQPVEFGQVLFKVKP